VAAVAGSPNYPRDTIAGASSHDPGGAVLAFTQELDGTSTSSANAQEFGVGDPAQTFVLKPLRAAAPLLGEVSVQGLPRLPVSDLRQAIANYDSASADQRMSWANNYDKALRTVMPEASGMGAKSPEYAKIGSLRGDFGPVPALVEADVYLAQTGYLEQYFQAVDPGRSFHLTNLWLYDHPTLLNTAVDQGLTDDQWGMVKERGFTVGPWYLFVPGVFHVYFPGGATGQGFVLWNLAFAVLLLFAVPLLPGLRSLPRHLKLYRFIYRYPKPGELESPALRERHGPVHAAGGGE
nr:hypothetical protein [Candidatus Dormibacteraeota bacterium]